MEKNKPWEQLAKYFAGELSAEERKKMESWIQADPEREKQVDQLYKVWKEAENPPYRLDVDDAWMKLSGDIDEFEFEKRKREAASRALGTGTFHKIPLSGKVDKKDKRPEIIWRRAILMAATILIIATAGYFSYQIHLQAELSESAKTENRVFVTRDGERATYVLSDGSKVMLHAGSRLEIPDDYNGENRELFLEGEAYFEVTHNKDKPFTVHSQYAYTRVLGTRFLVQAWPESQQGIEVVVSEGKVAFGDSREDEARGEKEVFITKNKMGIMLPDEKPVVTEVTDMNWYLGWTEGRLVFENRPLSEVLPRLERWYDIDIQVEDQQIRDKKITAEIDYSQSMSEVLKGIALTLGLEIKKDNRTVFFRAERNDLNR